MGSRVLTEHSVLPIKGRVYSQNQRDFLEIKDTQSLLTERQGGGLPPTLRLILTKHLVHRGNKCRPSFMNRFGEYALGRDKDEGTSESSGARKLRGA